MLRRAIATDPDRLAPDQHVLLKLTLPEEDNCYREFVERG